MRKQCLLKSGLLITITWRFCVGYEIYIYKRRNDTGKNITRSYQAALFE